MHWFGEPWPRPEWRAPICEDDALRIPTPVGQKCILCDEEIVEGDRGTQYANGPFAHAECGLRSVTGNHLHVAGMCRHTGDCNDLSNLSYRDEAKLVWAMQVHE